MGQRANLAGQAVNASGRLVMLGLLLATAPAAYAQQPSEWEARRFAATRVELTDLMTRAGQDPASAKVLAIVQQRLDNGDLHPGDGVALLVDGEEQLTDTFVVDAGNQIMLPGFGAITLRGVLYSELESRVSIQLSQYVRDPQVRARALLRVLISGAVPRPGFYLVAADAPMSETIMAAGGVTEDAKLREVRVDRGGAPTISMTTMQTALAQGWTLDRAGMRSGDEVVIPGANKSSQTYDRVRTIGILLTIPLTVYSLTKVFNGGH